MYWGVSTTIKAYTIAGLNQTMVSYPVVFADLSLILDFYYDLNEPENLAIYEVDIDLKFTYQVKGSILNKQSLITFIVSNQENIICKEVI